jgi:predicted dehydrogenase
MHLQAPTGLVNPALSEKAPQKGAKDSRVRRIALAGTGVRGALTWAIELQQQCSDFVDLVGLFDINPTRVNSLSAFLGGTIPAYTDFVRMLSEQKPDTVIVATRDDTHADLIIAAFEAGCDVIVEKPMATTIADCAHILAAAEATGRRLDVAFNYRHTPAFTKIKRLLNEGAVGDITAIDFHWYLDTEHGADYFRRWHAHRAMSGSLFVHKSTHHFDVLNWLVGARPARVSAEATQRKYSINGPYRGDNCRSCAHKSECPFYFDLNATPYMVALYANAEQDDGYIRDRCVFRDDIDIPDTMVATLAYANQVIVSYSLNTFMPIEGYHIAINGTQGRLELRQFEKQPWDEPPVDTIHVTKVFGDRATHYVPHEPGNHFGADVYLRRLLFDPDAVDELGQRASGLDGAWSIACGIAALNSADTHCSVSLDALVPSAWK